MNKKFLTTASLAFLLSSPAVAEALQPQAINSAALDAVTLDQSSQQNSEPNPAIVRLQILLDRAGASPGVIDGYIGENVSKAIAGFEAMQKLPVNGDLDDDVLKRLTDQAEAVQNYEISEDDSKDIVEHIPEDYAEQAKLKRLGYTSVAEALAERFHMDIDLLKALNPNAAFQPGETVVVAMVGDPKSGGVTRIEARKKTGQVFAFSDDGSLLAVYPATIGSEESPSPTGTHKVKGVARMPTYTYNPKVNFQQGSNTDILTLPAGPNGPVGTVWIDLSEPTYGIHGTPEPSLIDKTGSHGCVRLANWDVEELGSMVKPGVVVELIE